MTDRFDVVTSRKDKDGKWRNIKIGVAFPQEEGRISIILDALPISIWEGQVRMTLFPAKPKEEQSISQQAVAKIRKPDPISTGRNADMNGDDIPF